MPVIKSAIKKLRQDKKREKQNNSLRDSVKTVVRLAKKSKSGKAIAKAMATVDKAAKNNIIHKNKAARLKSTLSKIAKPISHKVIDTGVKSSAKQTPVKTKTTISKTKIVKKTVSKKSSK
jgi:small subunit ribosomal protein S20